MIGHLFSAILVAGTPATSTAFAPPSGTAAPRPDAARQRALQIARLLNDPVLTEKTATDQFLLGIGDTMKSDPQVAAIEKIYPGFFEEFGQAMLPFLVETIRTQLPVLWERQADFFVKTYTLAELDQIYAFYSSPTGLRLIVLMNENFDVDAMSAGIDFAAGDKLTVESMQAGADGAASEVVAGLSPADRKALMAMVATPAGQKMIRNAGALQAISVAWINEILLENPAFTTEAERQAKAIVERRAKVQSK